MKWHGAWWYGVHRTHWDGSSFMWHQPCQCCRYTTLVDLLYFLKCYKKLFTHAESHVSAASLLQSGEYNYTNYIWYSSDQQQQTLLVHARLFGCFHNPSNSDTDYVPMRSFRMRMYPHWGTSVCRLVPKGLCRVCTEFDSREISQLTQSLTNNGHPSIWWPRSIVLNSGFWVKQHANF